MREFNTTLYKKDFKGNIRFLTISTNNGYLKQESGLLGGKKVIHISKCKPKNTGKDNEITSEMQALLEAESVLNEKLEEGYFKTIEEAEDMIQPKDQFY